METISAKKLGISFNFDRDKYSVVINKNEKDDKNRLYFLCKKEDIENSDETVQTYFLKSENNFLETMERDIYYRNISQSFKVDYDIEIISDEGELIISRELIPNIYKEKSSLVLVI